MVESSGAVTLVICAMFAWLAEPCTDARCHADTASSAFSGVPSEYTRFGLSLMVTVLPSAEVSALCARSGCGTSLASSRYRSPAVKLMACEEAASTTALGSRAMTLVLTVTRAFSMGLGFAAAAGAAAVVAVGAAAAAVGFGAAAGALVGAGAAAGTVGARAAGATVAADGGAAGEHATRSATNTELVAISTAARCICRKLPGS